MSGATVDVADLRRADAPAGPPSTPAPTGPTTPRYVTTSGSWAGCNLAEDIHHERRRRSHRRTGSPPQPGSLAATFALLDAAAATAAGSAADRSGGMPTTPCGARTRAAG